MQGRIQDFKLGRAHLKKLRRAEGGAKIFGVFRVKNHDFTPKNLIFSYFRGGGRAPGAPHPGSAPDMSPLWSERKSALVSHRSYFVPQFNSVENGLEQITV